MPDPDLKRFQEGLEKTRHGMRLRLAIHESNIATKKIRQLRVLSGRSLNGQDLTEAIESWRRAYIAACNRASMAIDALWDDHQWPTEGARSRDFDWRPKKGYRRRVP